jgi:hypothetical protein
MDPQESWRSYDEFLRCAADDRFTKLLARYELYKRVIARPGDIVECGIFKGAGLLYFARLSRIFNPMVNRRIIGFDTFTGYPFGENVGPEAMTAQRFSDVAGYDIPSMDSLIATAEVLGLRDRIELVPGDARSSVKAYVRDNPGFRIALLNLDFDTYEATLSALEFLYPRVVPGGVVIVDEYGERGWGESDAVDEYFRGKNIALRSFAWATSPTAYFVK